MSAIQGHFLWYDHMTADADKAAAFYSEVFGWKSYPYDKDPSYTLFQRGEGPFGGLMQLPDEAKAQGAPNHWLAYIGCDDIDATLARAKDLGATVHKAATDIPEGRFAVLADPHGAVFALFKPAGEATPPAEGEGMVWLELMTQDPGAGFDFYGTLFGWKKTTAMDMGPQGTYQLFAAADMPAPQSMGGMMGLPVENIPPHWLCYASVGNVDDAVARIKQHGGQITHGPVEIPGGKRVATFLDNQGAAFAVHGD